MTKLTELDDLFNHRNEGTQRPWYEYLGEKADEMLKCFPRIDVPYCEDLMCRFIFCDIAITHLKQMFASESDSIEERRLKLKEHPEFGTIKNICQCCWNLIHHCMRVIGPYLLITESFDYNIFRPKQETDLTEQETRKLLVLARMDWILDALSVLYCKERGSDKYQKIVEDSELSVHLLDSQLQYICQVIDINSQVQAKGAYGEYLLRRRRALIIGMKMIKKRDLQNESFARQALALLSVANWELKNAFSMMEGRSTKALSVNDKYDGIIWPLLTGAMDLAKQFFAMPDSEDSYSHKLKVMALDFVRNGYKQVCDILKPEELDFETLTFSPAIHAFASMCVSSDDLAKKMRFREAMSSFLNHLFLPVSDRVRAFFDINNKSTDAPKLGPLIECNPNTHKMYLYLKMVQHWMKSDDMLIGDMPPVGPAFIYRSVTQWRSVSPHNDPCKFQEEWMFKLLARYHFICCLKTQEKDATFEWHNSKYSQYYVNLLVTQIIGKDGKLSSMDYSRHMLAFTDTKGQKVKKPGFTYKTAAGLMRTVSTERIFSEIRTAICKNLDNMFAGLFAIVSQAHESHVKLTVDKVDQWVSVINRGEFVRDCLLRLGYLSLLYCHLKRTDKHNDPNSDPDNMPDLLKSYLQRNRDARNFYDLMATINIMESQTDYLVKNANSALEVGSVLLFTILYVPPFKKDGNDRNPYSIKMLVAGIDAWLLMMTIRGYNPEDSKHRYYSKFLDVILTMLKSWTPARPRQFHMHKIQSFIQQLATNTFNQKIMKFSDPEQVAQFMSPHEQ